MHGLTTCIFMIYDTEVAERVKKNLNPFERLNVYRVATEALWQFAEMSP